MFNLLWNAAILKTKSKVLQFFSAVTVQDNIKVLIQIVIKVLLGKNFYHTCDPYRLLTGMFGYV